MLSTVYYQWLDKLHASKEATEQHYAPESQGARGSGVSAGHYTSSTRYSRAVSPPSSGDRTQLPERGTAGPSTIVRPHYWPNLWNILAIIRRFEGGASSRFLSPSSARGAMIRDRDFSTQGYGRARQATRTGIYTRSRYRQAITRLDKGIAIISMPR
jgi:hypothetical protein